MRDAHSPRRGRRRPGRGVCRGVRSRAKGQPWPVTLAAECVLAVVACVALGAAGVSDWTAVAYPLAMAFLGTLMVIGFLARR